MFTAEERDRVRQFVLEMARADERVTAGALIGSTAFGGGDQWSDIDITFGIVDGVAHAQVLAEWTQILEREWQILDHFDLFAGSSIYRVFLLPNGLEIDLSVTPATDFGARGPNFHLLFGQARQLAVTSQPEAAHLMGLCWHHVLHARSCIERHRLWQAEYWIGEVRNYVLALACLRLGESAVHGRGSDRLPAAVTDPLRETLVCSLDEPELRRALAAATRCLIIELEAGNPALCARLRPLLEEAGLAQAGI